MEISHLVVAGCSWTYCQGLKNPKLEGWPALVAKELGVPVVNLARPGIGNDAIHRRTYEYAFEDSVNKNNPFYIIAWTQTWRREAWCKHLYTRNKLHGYFNIAFPNNEPNNNLERAILDTWSEEDFFRRLMLYRLSLDSLFKNLGVNYFSTFFAEQEYNNSALDVDTESKVASVRERFLATTDYLQTNTNLIRNFYEIAGPYPKTHCGHEGPEGNVAIAQYVINEIKSRYSNISAVKKDYLPLVNYYQKTDPTETVHLDWI